MASRWVPTYKECPDYTPTQEGMTDFVKRHRDLEYCAKEGCREACSTCAAHKNNGYGACCKPTIRFTKGYASPY